MTPQSTFMILASIIPSREVDLRRLLDEMNNEPGRLNPMNAYVPFAQFDQIHFARIRDATSGLSDISGISWRL